MIITIVPHFVGTRGGRMRLILASSSPRRQALLKLITSDFELASHTVEERSKRTLPQHIVVDIAGRKAEAAIRAGHQGIILAADTLVLLDGQVLGKPTDRADARRMLYCLSGRVHTVLTGLWVVNTQTNQTAIDCVSTQVHFKRLSDGEIESYVQRETYADKAGSYGIQEHAACFIERLEGDYYNVMGLPVARTAQLLQRVGYPIEPSRVGD